METKSITDYIQTIQDIIPAIQMGLLPDTVGQVYHKFAESNSVTTTATLLSTVPNPDPFNTSGLQLYITSAGTDTQIIYIEGIDFTSGEMAAEYITLQGQTPVPLVNTYKTILRAYNTNGTYMTADAYIGSEPTPILGVPAVNNTYAHIPFEFDDKIVNQTLTSIFTIPTGYTGFVTNWYATATKGRDMETIAYARSTGSVFRYQERMFNFESSYQKALPWLRFPQGTDFKVEAKTSVGTIEGSCSYDIVLIHNDYINKERPLSWR